MENEHPTGTRPRRFGPTGPTSEKGKEISSANSLKHGCCSQKTILRDEKPEEFDAVLDNWLVEFNPQSPAAITLVQELARAHWFLRRANKRLEEVEYELPGNAYQWTEEHQKLFATFTRYKKDAERTFFRCFKTLESLCDKQDRQNDAKQRARNRAAAVEMRALSPKEEKVLNSLREVQIIDVEPHGENGEYVTTCTPSNEQMLQIISRRTAEPLVVTRYFAFPDGIPPAYDWCIDKDKHVPFTRAIRAQHMYYADWLNTLEHEKKTGCFGPIQRLPIQPAPESDRKRERAEY